MYQNALFELLSHTTDIVEGVGFEMNEMHRITALKIKDGERERLGAEREMNIKKENNRE